MECITSTFLDIIPCPVFWLKHSVSETGFCLCLQVGPTQLCPVDRASNNGYAGYSVCAEYTCMAFRTFCTVLTYYRRDNIKDMGSTFLRNVSKSISHYTASHP
jgi:hypothetical protein